MRLTGHLRTVYGHLQRRLRDVRLPPSEAWETCVPDGLRGSVRLTGRLQGGGRREALIVVHGLGGCAESGYVRATAAAAAARDLACLRLDLRGANRLGEDYYHAALTADLRAAIGSAPLSGYERLLVVGFSLGGHIALRHLLEEVDPRLDGVAAVCPPLDLAACCHWIDRRGGGIYRRYLLRKLMEIYEPVAARHEVPVAVEEARAIRSQREFDDRVIAPRHGFDGVDDYYRRASVGPRLGRIRHRALLVLAEDDPMIPRASQQRYVGGAGPGVVVRWVPGGHVAFAPRLSLGEPGPGGLDHQVVTWLLGDE